MKPLKELTSLEVEQIQAEPPLYSAQLVTETQSAAISEVLTWFEQIYSPHISARVWLECQTALIEGFDNVLQHAHQALPATTPILSKALIYSQAVELQLWDWGAPFDLATRLQNLPAQVSLSTESGRGLLLMRRVMDYLAYRRSADGRNCLLMVRLL